MKIKSTILAVILLVGCNENEPAHGKWMADSHSLAVAVQMYYRVTGELPTTEQGLDALFKRPENFPTEKKWDQMITRPARDAWGNTYQYRLIGEAYSEFEIRSLGPDGVSSEDDLVAKFPSEKPRDTK